MHTPLCDDLDIEFPIFAFTHCRDVVVAVSKAGGFGVLGAVGFTPDSWRSSSNGSTKISAIITTRGHRHPEQVRGHGLSPLG